MGNCGSFGNGNIYIRTLDFESKRKPSRTAESTFYEITGLEVATAKVEAIALNHNQNHFNSTLIIRDWWWTPHLVVQSNSDFWTRIWGYIWIAIFASDIMNKP